MTCSDWSTYFALDHGGACSLHFCSISSIAIFSRAHSILALFCISMHVRNKNSLNFLIKLTPKNGVHGASTTMSYPPLLPSQPSDMEMG